MDFRTYYFAAGVYSEGGNIYDPNQLRDLAVEKGCLESVFPYLYPPPLATYSASLSGISLGRASLLWSLISVGMGTLIVLNSFKEKSEEAGVDPEARGFLIPALSLFFLILLPFDNNFALGQINIIVLAAICVSLTQCIGCGRDFLAGLLLAIAVVLKVTPAFLLLFFLIEKRYLTLLGCGIGIIALVMPGITTSTGRNSWMQFFSFSNAMGYGKTIPGLFPASSFANFSVAGFLARLSLNESKVQLLSILILLGLGLGLLIQHFRLRGTRWKNSLLLSYFALMIIGSPLSYLHHVIYLFPGLMYFSRVTLGSCGRKTQVVLILLISLATMASIDFPLIFIRRGIQSPALASLNLYALLGLFLLGLLAPHLCKASVAIDDRV